MMLVVLLETQRCCLDCLVVARGDDGEMLATMADRMSVLFDDPEELSLLAGRKIPADEVHVQWMVVPASEEPRVRTLLPLEWVDLIWDRVDDPTFMIHRSKRWVTMPSAA